MPSLPALDVQVVRAVAAWHATDRPRDGDCLELAPAITAGLRLFGLPAVSAWVYGWVDPDQQMFVYGHRITVVEGLAVDVTAGQFHTRCAVPALWLEPLPVYLTRLADATGLPVATASLDPDPTPPPEEPC